MALWGNFDLVVIDESHNFRNNTKGKRDEDGDTISKSRYERLMEDIIQSGRTTWMAQIGVALIVIISIGQFDFLFPTCT
jgi:hypothetical protein